MEDAPASDFYAQPKHPYSQILLGRAAPLAEDESLKPTSVAATSGVEVTRCPFTDRCPFRQDLCFKERPALRELAAGHRAACHFA